MLYHLREGDGRCRIKHQVELHVAQMPLDGPFELCLHQHLSDAFLDDVGLLQIEGTHSQDMHTVHFIKAGLLARAPLARRHDIHLVTLIAELPHEVAIDARSPHLSKVGHGKENEVHWLVNNSLYRFTYFSKHLSLSNSFSARSRHLRRISVSKDGFASIVADHSLMVFATASMSPIAHPTHLDVPEHRAQAAG